MEVAFTAAGDGGFEMGSLQLCVKTQTAADLNQPLPEMTAHIGNLY